MTVTGPPDDYTDHLKTAAHEALSITDIVERLRKPMVKGFTHPMDAERAEAADTIERLRAAVKTQGAEIDRLCELLRRALEPKT